MSVPGLTTTSLETWKAVVQIRRQYIFRLGRYVTVGRVMLFARVPVDRHQQWSLTVFDLEIFFKVLSADLKVEIHYPSFCEKGRLESAFADIFTVVVLRLKCFLKSIRTSSKHK